jgi:uncharacterized protein YcfJ
MQKLFVTLVCSAAVLLSACASHGASSPSARPVFYPNATLNRVGEAQAQSDSDQCSSNAKNAGLTPDEKDNAVARGAVKGAAIGGTVGAVSALVRGHPVQAVENGVAGAAVGGAAGAVAGSFHEKANATYRHYVQRCLKDLGYDVIGWN